MKSSDVRSKYITFFQQRSHVHIPSAPLVPENDPTTLFNSSGMQPLVPYLLGEVHPSGRRLVNSQKAIRLQDIEDVGDNRHTTFFEMLGNWSLGDYFKKEQLSWVFQFLTKEIGLDPKCLYVTVFEGNESVPKDVESIALWKDIFATVGINAKENERIFSYPAKKNWWSRSGEPEKMPAGEPGGPDSELFFDFGEQLNLHEQSVWKNEQCHPNCDCGRFMEIGNSVFMQYQKHEDGSIQELKQKNVDFGGGLERIVAASENTVDVFATDFFAPLINHLELTAKMSYGMSSEVTTSMRIIADHARASVMLLSDGVLPSNKQQGYVLRRLIRRALLHGRKIGLGQNMSYFTELAEPISAIYQDAYPAIPQQLSRIQEIVSDEVHRFGKTLEKGMKEIEKVSVLDGKTAFHLYESFGFPWEMTVEIAQEKGQTVEREQFENEFKAHQEISRTASAGMFKGGLADHSEQTTRLHTAHHLLLAALQKQISPSIKQRGSNITGDRLRIDISFDRKLTVEELSQVEKLVNEKIEEAVPVIRIDMPKEEAETIGAQMEFGKKYPEMVSVYFVGSRESFFSAEFCGGPHVTNTGELGKGNKTFVITKQERIGSGVVRLKAELR